jgi:hypothetical protein
VNLFSKVLASRAESYDLHCVAGRSRPVKTLSISLPDHAS